MGSFSNFSEPHCIIFFARDQVARDVLGWISGNRDPCIAFGCFPRPFFYIFNASIGLTPNGFRGHWSSALRYGVPLNCWTTSKWTQRFLIGVSSPTERGLARARWTISRVCDPACPGDGPPARARRFFLLLPNFPCGSDQTVFARANPFLSGFWIFRALYCLFLCLYTYLLKNEIIIIMNSLEP